MKKLLMILPLALTLCFMFSCKGKKANVEKFMEDGVEVVQNFSLSKNKSEHPVLSPILSIDTENAELAECGLSDIWGFDVINFDMDNSVPEGTSLHVENIGIVDGEPDQHISSMRQTKVGDSWELFTKSEAISYILEAFFEDELLFRQEISTDGSEDWIPIGVVNLSNGGRTLPGVLDYHGNHPQQGHVGPDDIYYNSMQLWTWDDYAIYCYYCNWYWCLFLY